MFDVDTLDDSPASPMEGPALTVYGLSREEIAHSVGKDLGWSATRHGQVFDHRRNPLGHVGHVAAALDELGWIETSTVAIDGALVDRYTTVRYDKFDVDDRDRTTAKFRKAALR